MSSAVLKGPKCSSAVSLNSFSPMASASSQAGTMACMVPRCEIKIEKCQSGCKIYCACDDELACSTLQNLCRALAGGMCSVHCTWNGVTLCQCNFACGHCRCEMTDDGVCVCCTSDDQTCCSAIQAMCECLCRCFDNGCNCTVCFNHVPVCCDAN